MQMWSSHPNANLHWQSKPVLFRSDYNPFHFTLPKSCCQFHFSDVFISYSGAATTKRSAYGFSLPTFAANVLHCCAAFCIFLFIYLHLFLLCYPASHYWSSHIWTGFKRRVIVHAQAWSYAVHSFSRLNCHSHFIHVSYRTLLIGNFIELLQVFVKKMDFSL